MRNHPKTRKNNFCEKNVKKVLRYSNNHDIVYDVLAKS